MPARRPPPRRGSGWTLSGTKSVVPAGDQADAFIVPAVANGQIALFLAERSAPGVITQGYRTQDGGRAAEVVLSNTPASLVSTKGLAALEHMQDIGIAAVCAEAVGVMDKTLAITVDYMNTRKQFGVAIASFQALRHRVADMKMQLELARSMSYYASLKLNAPADERRRGAGSRQGATGQFDAIRGSAGGAAARRHRRDRRIHRQPLFQETHPAGDVLWRHPSPPGRSVQPDAGHGRGLRLTKNPAFWALGSLGMVNLAQIWGVKGPSTKAEGAGVNFPG